MEKRIPATLFIGPFPPPFAGDGVKNSALKDGFTTARVQKFIWYDTICRTGNPYLHWLKLLALLVKSKQVILSVNKRGRYVIISLFYFLRLVTNKRAALYVIGGTLDRQIGKLPTLKKWLYLKALKKLDGIFAESKLLLEGLQALGLTKVELVFNPRVDSGARWNQNHQANGKIVFISRITEDKGVSVLLDAFKLLVEEGHQLSLDFYGPIDPDYDSTFREKLEKLDGKANFRGQVSPDQVQDTLVNYHFLVLPTFHFGEGLPGILVEAAMAGVPIITTRFNSLPEYFEHGISALLAEPQEVESLKTYMEMLLTNHDLSITLSREILKVSLPFKSSTIIEQSLQLLTSYGWVIKTNSDEI